jgi:hypothetical protein
MSSQRDVEDRGGRSADHNTRERMLAELPVTERRLQLAASPPPCWKAGTDRRCFCCMAQESSRLCGDG